MTGRETPAETAETAELERLRARVAALESALERRSHELRLIQRYVCQRDFLLIARLQAGLSPLPRGAFEPGFWRETTALTTADVEDTLQDLWTSLTPPNILKDAEEL